MYNANKPDPNELPGSAQLLKSTILAALAALVILVTIVLPAEYGIDPTRVGKLIGLAEMGEIKMQLAREAEEDHGSSLYPGAGEAPGVWQSLHGLLVGTAHAQSEGWTDEVSFTLAPGEGTEIKLVMDEGAVAEFRWVAENGVVNYDLHGDGGGESVSYERGRAVSGDEGDLTAAFAGNHGWFWRNRDDRDVTVTLYVRGEYSALKRM